MPIAKSDIENIYPLTPVQQGMLFHALLEPRSQAYFEQLSWRMQGSLDVAALEASWNLLIERHAILRTLFAHEGSDEPLQVVLKSRPIAIERVDLRGADPERAAADYKAAERARGFALNRDPLLRVAVLRLCEERFELVWSHHHIILDGWSVGLALAELVDIYRARRAGTPPVLPPVTPFARFVKWLLARDRAAAGRFWAAHLAGCAERVTIPHTRVGAPASREPQRGVLAFGLGAEATAALRALAVRRGVTFAVVLHAIWAVLLGRYADADDVVFGSVVSGRPAEIPGVDQIIGNFINTIPVRARLDRAATFDELLAAMQRDAAESLPYQHTPLSTVQSTRRMEEGLFGTLVSFANYPVDPRLTGEAGAPSTGFVVDAVTHVEQTHYDVDVQFVAVADLQVRITYAARLYDPVQMAALEHHFRAVAAAVAGRAGIRLDEIDAATDSEREELLREPPATLHDTLVAAFERQVREAPARRAVLAGGETLTYAQLDRRANALAHRLRAAATIEPDTTVAVLVGRGVELAVALLAVLKAGGAYVPLEASLPRERIAYILDDAGCKAVVADGATVETARAASRLPVVPVDEAPGGCCDPVAAAIRPRDLAYVIYTSGSTGRPKGVMIEHHSAVNLVAGLREHLYRRYEGALNVALVASCSFDASVQQIFAALTLGHTLVIVDEATRRDGAAMNRFLSEQAVDVMDGTPTLLAMMARSPGFDAACRSVRHALIGGEPLPWALATQVLRPGGMAVSNVYGPTECCVDATAHLVAAAAPHEAPSVAVGRALPNVRVFVIDRTGHLAPRGARGEICIAGAGVGRGYVGDEALTAAKFVRLAALGGVRAFRTGDAGRMLPDGTLDCLGRYDDQVKVRGYRIEIGEIEHQLAQHPGVEQAAAFVVRGEDGNELHAALVLAAPVHVDELRAHLGEMLPEHMIPSRFVRVAALPRTESGKLDRRRLATQAAGEALEVGADYAAPASETERALAQAWEAALGVARVGIDDNYFSLGGDSIKAIQILSRLARQGLRMEMRDLFRHRTIRSLAPFVVRTQAQSAPAADGAPVLTAAQARFFAEHGAATGQFHHAVLFDSREPLEPALVARAFAAVRDRHEALRCTFAPAPRAASPGAPAPEVAEVRSLDAALPGLLAPFDLAAGPLHRLAIVRGTGGDRLLVVLHHLCVDGVSWRILVEDLGVALAAARAGATPRFAEAGDAALAVAAALARHGASDAARGELAYWREVEAQSAPLVAWGDEPCGRHADRASLDCVPGRAATEALMAESHRAYGTTVEDLLLTALARALHARFGATRTGVLLESHGRAPLAGIDASRTVGWFTSLHPFVLALEPARDLAFQVQSMKEAVRAIPDGGRGYGLLRYRGGAALDARPQVSFNYLGRFDAGDETATLRPSAEAIEGGVDPAAPLLAELEASAIVLAGELRLMLAYNRRRFEGPAMGALMQAWREELGLVVQHCREQSGTRLTPADLSYSQLTVDELEGLFK